MLLHPVIDTTFNCVIQECCRHHWNLISRLRFQTSWCYQSVCHM